MFRVPVNPEDPSFNDTTEVGFFKWLLSKKAERVEWVRLRNVAADNARMYQNMRGNQTAWRLLREHARKRVAREVLQGRRTQAEADAFLQQLDDSRPPVQRVV